jgi:hypothetical protein
MNADELSLIVLEDRIADFEFRKLEKDVSKSMAELFPKKTRPIGKPDPKTPCANRCQKVPGHFSYNAFDAHPIVTYQVRAPGGPIHTPCEGCRSKFQEPLDQIGRR